VKVFRFATVNPQDTNSFGQLAVLGDDHAGIAERAQVFAREKGEAAKRADRPCRSFASILRSDGLGGIFDYGYSMLASSSQDRVHLGTRAEKMNRKDSLTTLGYLRFNSAHVKIEGAPVDIDEHRTSAEPSNNSGCGKKGKRACDHLVAGTDSDRH
jgi:hypothetical protein